MGQRLNIEIHRGEKALANAYYHWSAYTQSALELTQEIISTIEEVKESDPVVEAVRLLEATGAGMPPQEKERVNQVRDVSIFKDSTDRSSGLISITNEGIAETREWQEGRVIIDLDNEMIQFDVCGVDKLEYYKNDEEMYKEMKSKFDSYWTYNFDLTHFPFEDVEFMMGIVNEVIDEGDCGYKLADGTVMSLIV